MFAELPEKNKLLLPRLRKLNPDYVVKNVKAYYRYYGDLLLWTKWQEITVKELIEEIELGRRNPSMYSNGYQLIWRGDI